MNHLKNRISTWIVAGALATGIPSALALSMFEPHPAVIQQEKETDTELTRSIRREMAKHDKLSTEAQAIEITAKDGMVTMKGKVKSNEEKTSLVKIATDIAGAGKVEDRLEVSAPPQAEIGAQ